MVWLIVVVDRQCFLAATGCRGSFLHGEGVYRPIVLDARSPAPPTTPGLTFNNLSSQRLAGCSRRSEGVKCESKKILGWKKLNGVDE